MELVEAIKCSSLPSVPALPRVPKPHTTSKCMQRKSYPFIILQTWPGKCILLVQFTPQYRTQQIELLGGHLQVHIELMIIALILKIIPFGPFVKICPQLFTTT